MTAYEIFAAWYDSANDEGENVRARGDTDQEFFDAYCREHEKTFGEPFFLDDPNPVW